MSMSIHLTNTRGLWFWSIIADGTAFKACDTGHKSAVEAQAEARRVLTNYRKLWADLQNCA